MKKKLSLILITSLFSLSLTANRYPLHDACTQGNLKAVQKLLVDYEQMPSVIKKIVNANDNYKRTPLHITAKKGHLPIVKYLVSMGAYVNAKNSFGLTPLHDAAIQGKLGVVKLLIEFCSKKGILFDLNIRDNKGYLAQDLALQVGHRNIYNYLRNTPKQLIVNRLGSMTNVFGV